MTNINLRLIQDKLDNEIHHESFQYVFIAAILG